MYLTIQLTYMLTKRLSQINLIPSRDIYAVGLMSGTSLDGLDIALVRFMNNGGKLGYQLIDGTTVVYSEQWKRAFKELPTTSALLFAQAHNELGRWMGQAVKQFLKGQKHQPEFIGSHGHTIFHQPDQGLTVQIGCGAQIAAQTGLVTVNDFRTYDVALGGQGAPLVPIGDKLLFTDYVACLNLGGIANISFDDSAGKRLAFDVCAVNQVLNHLAARFGLDFDAGGTLARSGKLLPNLLNELNALPFYQDDKPKSLGREWVQQQVLPLLDEETESANDLLHTYSVHIAHQIRAVVDRENLTGPILCTGGGTHNTFLVDLINRELARKAWLHVPDQATINFKEAILFALLAYLRLKHANNALSSVTGASRDNIGGAVYAGLDKINPF